MESVYGLVEAAALEVWTARCQLLLRASMFAEGRSEVLGPFPPHHNRIGGSLDFPNMAPITFPIPQACLQTVWPCCPLLRSRRSKFLPWIMPSCRDWLVTDGLCGSDDTWKTMSSKRPVQGSHPEKSQPQEKPQAGSLRYKPRWAQPLGHGERLLEDSSPRLWVSPAESQASQRRGVFLRHTPSPVPDP